jgi:hypothetical protein
VVSFFKDKSPGNLLVLLAFGFLLKLPLFLYPKIITATENDEDIYHYIVSGIGGSSQAPIYFSIVAILLLFIQAFMINYIVNEYRMISRQTFLPAMAYLLVTSLLPEWNYLSSPMLASTLILWCFLRLFSLYSASRSMGPLFNIGLVMGISSYIYFPSASFLICILLGILILKPFRLNEIILFLLGALTPYYFFGIYLFLADKFSIENFVPNVSVHVPEVKSSIYLAITTCLIAIPFVAGGFFVQSHLHKMLIQVRKNWSIILLYLLLAFFVPFVNSYSTFGNWILLAAPFAAFHAAAYYYPERKWFPLSLLVLTTGFVIFQQYATDLWR